MTPSQAKSRVVLGVGGAAALTAGAAIVKRQQPRVRIVFGAFVAGLVLLAVADWSPDLAGRFAVVVLLTSLLTAGGVLAGAIPNVLGAPK